MRRALLVLLCLLLTALCACRRVEQPPAEGAYYLRDTADGPVWEERAFAPTAETAAEQCLQVLAALQRPPEGLRAALPAEVTVLSLRVSGNVVYLDFSAEYAALEAGARSMACAAAVRGLLKLPGLYYVSVTADGAPQSPLYERYGTADTFVME